MPHTTLSTRSLVNYGQPIETELEKLAAIIAANPALAKRYPPRWLAIQLLERDDDLLAEVQSAGATEVLAALDETFNRLEPLFGADVDVALANARYRFVNNLVHQIVKTPANPTESLSDRVDRIVTNQWLGIPIFLGIMWFGRGVGVCTGVDVAIPCTGTAGRFRLHGACCLCDGQVYAHHRVTRKKFSADDCRVRMQCARRVCYPHARKSA